MFKPCGSHVLVKQVPTLNATANGIIVNSDEEAKRRQMAENVGILVDVGPMAWEFVDETGKTFVNEQAKVGDVVVFARYSGQQYTEGEIMSGRKGKDEPFYHLMPSADILGVMPKDRADEYKAQRGLK